MEEVTDMPRIVEEVLLADGVLTEGAFHRWIPTLNANAGGGQRANTTGERSAQGGPQNQTSY